MLCGQDMKVGGVRVIVEIDECIMNSDPLLLL